MELLLHDVNLLFLFLFSHKNSEQVLISIQNEREWKFLCLDVLQKPELVSDEKYNSNTKRVDNRLELDKEINNSFGKFERRIIIDKLKNANIAYGQLSSVEDLAKHPQSIFVKVSTSEGEIELLSPGAIVNGENFNFGSVPFLGEHTENIKREFK